MDDKARTRMVQFCFLGMCLWNLVVSLDSTALSVALPTIASELNASTNQAFWTGTSFVLCSAAIQPVFASFSDAFGRKPMVLVALILFTIGAIICGIAQHISILILGRSIQGVGGGGLLTMTYVLMADILTLQERGKLIGLISLTWLVGTVCGPIVGGGFAQSASWRWVFWFNLPFCGLCFLAVVPFLKSNYKPQGTLSARLRRIDWIGSVLFVGSLTTFLLGISWGGSMYAWSSWRTIVPLVLGLVGLGAWAAYSHWLTDRPMIPFMILDNRTALISYFGNLIQGLCQFGILYYLPLYYQGVKGYSPIIAGVALLPQCLLAGPSSAVVGILISKTHRIKPFVLIGWTFFTFGLGLLSLLNPNTTLVEWIFINIPSGLGLGMLFSSLALATQASVEVSDRSPADVAKLKGMAASLNPFFRTIGQAFGIVISQAAFINQMKHKVGDRLAMEAAALAQIIPTLPPKSVESGLFKWAFSESLDAVWWILFALAATMLALSFATKDSGLNAPRSAALPIETVESHDMTEMSQSKNEAILSVSPTGSSTDDDFEKR